jgi:pimeloyl-ACP methyl ester carboxylesterase
MQQNQRATATRRKLRPMILKLLLLVLVPYLAVFLMLASKQRTFMYHPQRGDEKQFLQMAENENVEPWRDAQNNFIGWKRVLDSPAKNRLLIFHGNGGHALSRTYFMDGFAALDEGQSWEFYALEYPGYGWRDGNTSESEIVQAADEALRELLAHDSRPVYLAGESLGSGVACLLAAKHPETVRGLFLTTPYTSIVEIAQGRFPVFPVRLVLRDRYEAARALEKYRGPVAILLAGRDLVVPTHYGQKLFDGYNGPKRLWVQPDAGHNTLDYDARANWWREVSLFLQGT